jgi:hypothetical protein
MKFLLVQGTAGVLSVFSQGSLSASASHPSMRFPWKPSW